MREICLDEGILQSYLDGELSLEMTEQVAGHISACASCAAMVSEAEGELALFNAAFAAESAWPIPTEELRVRINRAIDALDEPAPEPFGRRAESGLRHWLGTLAASFSFKPQRAAAFASIVALVAFGLIFAAVYRQGAAPSSEVAHNEIARNQELPAPVLTPAATNEKGAREATDDVTNEEASIRKRSPRRSFTQNRGAGLRTFEASDRVSSPKRETPPSASDVPGVDNRTVASMQELPGEKSYLKTIASLTTVIDAGASAPMKPTLRVEYERNLALVNQAIAATRPVALKKPSDSTAAQFLYAAYQSKIDLLSAVADQQSEAVARR